MSKPETPNPEHSTHRPAVPTAKHSPLAYRVDDAATVIGVSASKVWSLIREGRLLARRLDGSTIIRHETWSLSSTLCHAGDARFP